MTTNPLGAPVPDWTPPPAPDLDVIGGRIVRLERLRADAHAADLYAAYQGHHDLWDYMPIGPFLSFDDFRAWVQQAEAGRDPLLYAIVDQASGRAVGQASFLRIAPAAGSIEVGFICFSPELKRAPAATEAMYLMMRWAFDAGYRRYEWKCDALNRPSRRAAQRLGFSYEGIFRQAVVVKGRNRDTAWFAMIDKEWPALRLAFETWLAPENFDAGGRQIQRLSDLTAPIRVTSDPTLAE
ncbi:GNAT family N-acetyltransferase [Actibacterium sp. XHP0104]|uniref:GNAT family N-acetyltransferase n=1 Tax=Actibacterium sp. XHP0104 TaxID=2984335 RepID=UPI0021E92E2F|nr:GNAT family protein [Actibacterium sp. XHP0104]MCV2880461.1 GNAT family N-acetyltransferase [Actibacterium sp. XHP0104]